MVKPNWKLPIYDLTLNLPNKLLSAKLLVCFHFQSASMSIKVGENVVLVSNSLDPGETPSYSASHLDPLFAYGTIVVLGALWVSVLFH